MTRDSLLWVQEKHRGRRLQKTKFNNWKHNIYIKQLDVASPFKIGEEEGLTIN